MLIGRALAIARLRGLVPATWRGWAYMALALAYVLAILTYAISSGVDASIGAGILLAVNAGLLILDWRAFVTLGGLLSGRRLGPGGRLGMLLLLGAGWIAPPIVLWRLAVRTYRGHQAELAGLPARIAELERELGMDGSHIREDAECDTQP